jgi:hypothetical protein
MKTEFAELDLNDKGKSMLMACYHDLVELSSSLRHVGNDNLAIMIGEIAVDIKLGTDKMDKALSVMINNQFKASQEATVNMMNGILNTIRFEDEKNA